MTTSTKTKPKSPESEPKAAAPKAAPDKPEPFDPDNLLSVPLDPSRLKKGDLVCIIQYAQVVNAGSSFGNRFAELKDLDTGTVWTRTGDDILRRMKSGVQHEESVVKVTNTNLIKVLMNAGHRPFTVTWTKKDGSERTLRGRYVSAAEHSRGYSWVEDLDLPPDERGGRLRQVDHRTLISVVLDGVKYVQK